MQDKFFAERNVAPDTIFYLNRVMRLGSSVRFRELDQVAALKAHHEQSRPS
ncbi:hypothetical protein I5M27_04990 [Adhaeribacter sp. BT258]|uniref:Uncharacterized protein n=1 Tax=Adhaeribacter terrigena TaxID=2793070 RepID=A0ABS1BZ25_9BACT|nr:hypothetical protein [Adhaeribacter terrigena]MBK0402329.1 hypothetical protein [Adhaeribacter terrigena]